MILCSETKMFVSANNSPLFKNQLLLINIYIYDFQVTKRQFVPYASLCSSKHLTLCLANIRDVMKWQVQLAVPTV